MKKTLLPSVQMLEEAKASGRGYKLWKEILLFLLVFFITQTVVSVPVSIATVAAVFSSDTFMNMIEEIAAGNAVAVDEVVTQVMNAMPDWLMVVQLFSTALATAGAVFYCRVFEKRSLSSMGLHRRGILREYGIGVIIGILLISACVGLCMLTGSLTLKAASFSPLMWVLFLLGFLIQGMSEEVICRGYMMVSVSRKNALWLAVLTNSVVFGLLHLGNPGFGALPMLNIVLFGILESVYVIKRGSLWGACAIHSLWNFFQGNVFGISVSGTGSGASPLSATMTEGHEWINGGSFGLEGGLAVTLIIGAVTLLMLFCLPSKKEELVPAAAPEEPSQTAKAS